MATAEHRSATSSSARADEPQAGGRARQSYRGWAGGGAGDCLGGDGSAGRDGKIKPSRSDRLGVHDDRCCSFGAAVGCPPSEAFPVGDAALGVFSAGVARLLAGIFSNGFAGAAAVVCLAAAEPSSAGRVAACGDTGVSTLPRMIGRPSLPPPMMTTLELLDWASCSVASMPRQRT